MATHTYPIIFELSLARRNYHYNLSLLIDVCPFEQTKVVAQNSNDTGMAIPADILTTPS
jgi:hypothetical protein